jgi:predicted type IV restriction endonuclease
MDLQDTAAARACQDARSRVSEEVTPAAAAAVGDHEPAALIATIYIRESGATPDIHAMHQDEELVNVALVMLLKPHIDEIDRLVKAAMEWRKRLREADRWNTRLGGPRK